MAQTCALIAPVQPILHRVSCSNETLPNASKYYETHQNMSLGSNGVDRVRSLKNSDATSWQEASCRNKTIQNAPKHYETQQYISLGSNGVGQVRSLRKIQKQLHDTNLCIN